MPSPGSLKTFLRTAVAVVLVPTLIGGYSLAAIALALVGVGPKGIHSLYVSISRVLLRIASTRILVEGAGSIDPERDYVVVPKLRTRARERLREAGIDPGGID